MLKYDLVPEDQSENRNREMPIYDSIKYCSICNIDNGSYCTWTKKT